MTEQVLGLIAGGAAGVAIGLFHFGLLWLTVARIEGSAHPWRLLLGSFVVRTAGTVLFFYLVMTATGWPGLVAAMLGFLLVRVCMVRMLRPAPKAC